MREAHADLSSQEFKLIMARTENATKEVTAVFNTTCTTVLKRKGIEGFRPPFEVVIGLGGLATRLHYWVDD